MSVVYCSVQGESLQFDQCFCPFSVILQPWNACKVEFINRMFLIDAPKGHPWSPSFWQLGAFWSPNSSHGDLHEFSETEHNNFAFRSPEPSEICPGDLQPEISLRGPLDKERRSWVTVLKVSSNYQAFNSLNFLLWQIRILMSTRESFKAMFSKPVHCLDITRRPRNAWK